MPGFASSPLICQKKDVRNVSSAARFGILKEMLKIIDYVIKNTILNAEKFNIPLSVCGEMAGSKESAVVLAGMGVRNLSMIPKQIPVIKEMLSHFSIKELENLSNRSVF